MQRFLPAFLSLALSLGARLESPGPATVTNGSCFIQTVEQRLQRRSSLLFWSDLKASLSAGPAEVPAGQTWVLDHPMDVESLRIRGTLRWDTSQEGLELRAGFVVVEDGGHLEVGSKEAPMDKKATIYIKKGASHPTMGKRALGAVGSGKIDMHGRKLGRTWSLLSRDAFPGDKQLFLKEDPISMGWRVGDRIGVATTSRGHSTVHTIVAISAARPEPPQCPKLRHIKQMCSSSGCRVLANHMYMKSCRKYCAENGLSCLAAQDGDNDCRPKSNISCDTWLPGHGGYDLICECQAPAGASAPATPGGNVLHLAEPLEEMHWGGHRTIEGRRLELAAEVVNLERSVLVTGDHDDFESSHEGLHTKVMGGRGYMDMRYARVEYCGQRGTMGRYCLHLHLMQKCPRCVFEGNAIVEGAQVGITIHGTHNALISNNVIWNGRAAGIYTEDGNEMNNLIKQNVVICSHWQECSVDWVGGNHANVAGIYMIGMTNDLIENRVVGHENCIWTPGASRYQGKGHAWGKVCPAHSPFGTIRGNVNHDCQRFGIYLDNQYPRNLKRDENGFLTEPTSCDKFTKDGKDNGLVPANVVQDELDYHNMFVGQYAMGDVQFVNFTSVNNIHSMYWKASKNFADGRLWHVKDSLFINDASDPIGVLRFLGPGGPFVFGVKDTAFVGGPVIGGALGAGQHCGLGGAGGPCVSQYLLEGVNLREVVSGAAKVKFGVSSTDDGKVLPSFHARDDSLGGFRSLVSGYLDGFKYVPGCRSAGSEWADAIACERPVRRLNVWGKDVGDLYLSGPGYQTHANGAAPVHGMNAGRMRYEPVNGKGWGAPVLAGQSYSLRGHFHGGDFVIDFSDEPLSEYFGDKHEFVFVEVNGRRCQLRADSDRRYLSPKGPVWKTLPSHVRVQGGWLQCAQR